MHSNKENAEKIPEKAKTLVEKAGISELEKRSITQASGGQLQRVGICRALMNNAKVIFGDEPTGALNSKSANEFMRLVADIHQSGTTIVSVTHDVKVVSIKLIQ